MMFEPSVSSEIFDLRPDYCALSVVVDGIDNTQVLPAAVLDALEFRGARPDWADAHLEAWRAAYRAFGAKPQRTPCSAEALAKRVESAGQLPRVNSAVDLYNAISVRYAVPVGGENIAAYQGLPRLVRARGGEVFDTVKDGAVQAEAVPAGEVVWCDDRGVTCRRWNWRQGVRTRIDAATRSMWFVLERLDPMPITALLEAGRLLAAQICRLGAGAQSTMSMIDRASTPQSAPKIAT